ncbi:ABC transporter substrate-binding protein [Streptacidiphilus sp. N1-3]|uniref:ABC transporter substrate-binding protein n=1 Tax=Streptacidiphilus alkalitolerans TaxID=3342712 RepID=A0ABV6WVN6_9ACTN
MLPRRTAGKVLAAVLLAAVLPLAACGSRLPERDFAGPPATAPGATGGSAPPPLTVGIVTSVSSVLGTEAFSGPLYGAQAFFRALDAAGGLGGRQVKVVTCDDSGSGSGNQACVHKLIDQDHVLALVATSALDYAGAPYVSAKGVPDIGGEPIGTAYDRYPHLYQIYGSSEPRDGRAVGWNGTQYATTEVYRYFAQKLGLHSAAVVGYNQADSARYAAQLVQGLKAEGYRVLTETVDFALPNFAAVAAQLKAHGTQLLLDAMDTRGNVALCQAMASAGVAVAAKVTNVQNWTARAGSDYQAVPGCLDALWATADSRSYEDVRYPTVAAFRAAMKRYFPSREGQLSQWEVEGWAAAQWFADAAGSCGAQVDRACLDRYLQRPEPYDAHGLLIPTGFTPKPAPTGPQRACLDVARWQGGADGGWVTQVADMDTDCFQVPALPYRS